MVVGLVVAVGGVLGALYATRALGLRAGSAGENAFGWLAFFMGIGGLVLAGMSGLRREATIDVARRESAVVLTRSWGEAIYLVRAPVEMGQWANPYSGTSIGVFAVLVGDQGRIVVGGKDHTGDGYELGTTARTRVDFEIGRADFDALLAYLGVTQRAVDEWVIDCVDGPRTGPEQTRLYLSMLGVVGLALLSVFSLNALGLRDEIVMAGFVFFLAVGGYYAYRTYWLKGLRARALRLHIDGLGITVVREQEPRSQLAWERVRAKRQLHQWTAGGRISYTTTIRVLELTLDDGEPLYLGLEDPFRLESHGQEIKLPLPHRGPWPGELVEEGARSKVLYVSPPKWPQLVAALEQHGRIG
jgi:hypothetical protein